MGTSQPPAMAVDGANASVAAVLANLGIPSPLLKDRPPTVMDGSTRGQVVGGFWRQDPYNNLWTCLSSTPGDAHWTAYSLGSYPLPGDASTSAVLLAYGMCRLVSSYTGPLCQITRTSDSTTLDIDQMADGTFNWAKYNAFVKGTTGFVTVRYNQGSAGSVGDLVQATTANAPFITPVHKIGRHPSLVFPVSDTRFMTLRTPGSVSLTKNALSAATITRNAVGAGNFACLFQLGTGSDSIQVINNASAPGISVSFGTGAAGPATETPEITTLISPSSGTYTLQHGQDTAQTGAAFTSAALVDVRIGTGVAVSGNHAVAAVPVGEFGGLLIWGSSQSATDMLNVRASLILLFETTPQAQDVVVRDGESNTEGFGTYSYYNEVRQLSDAYQGRARIINAGVAGETTATMLANWDARVKPFYSASRKTNIYVLWPGANGIWSNGNTADQEMANILAIVAKAVAQGFKVFVCTQPDRTGTAGQLVIKNALSALIAAPATQASSGYTAIPIHLSPLIGVDGQNTSSYFSSDHAHLSASGGSVAEQIEQYYLEPALTIERAWAA